jgi:hypothetical protein
LIELERRFILPLARRWVRHSYLSKRLHTIPYTCGISPASPSLRWPATLPLSPVADRPSSSLRRPKLLRFGHRRRRFFRERPARFRLREAAAELLQLGAADFLQVGATGGGSGAHAGRQRWSSCSSGRQQLGPICPASERISSGRAPTAWVPARGGRAPATREDLKRRRPNLAGAAELGIGVRPELGIGGGGITGEERGRTEIGGGNGLQVGQGGGAGCPPVHAACPIDPNANHIWVKMGRARTIYPFG